MDKVARESESRSAIYEKLGSFDIEVTIPDCLTTLFYSRRSVLCSYFDFYPISTICFFLFRATVRSFLCDAERRK